MTMPLKNGNQLCMKLSVSMKSLAPLTSMVCSFSFEGGRTTHSAHGIFFASSVTWEKNQNTSLMDVAPPPMHGGILAGALANTCGHPGLTMNHIPNLPVTGYTPIHCPKYDSREGSRA